jgi:pyrroline-5-carboxylate reductase
MKIGFIGMGNMGRAMAEGAIRVFGAGNCVFSVPDRKHGEETAAATGMTFAMTNVQAADADIVVLAVKPQVYAEVAGEIRGNLPQGALVVSPAPGITIGALSGMLGGHEKIARIMPNLAAKVGESMTGVTYGDALGEEDRRAVETLLKSFGGVAEVPEKLMDAVVCVSGSSPAYVYIFIEALADSAVKYGIPRKTAVKMAAQTVLGAAKMVLETGEDPAVLKNAVCSPAGTTIQGVSALEECGFRSAVIRATDACYKKCTEIK